MVRDSKYDRRRTGIASPDVKRAECNTPVRDPVQQGRAQVMHCATWSSRGQCMRVRECLELHKVAGAWGSISLNILVYIRLAWSQELAPAGISLFSLCSRPLADNAFEDDRLRFRPGSQPSLPHLGVPPTIGG